MRLQIAYKLELKPTKQQMQKISKSIGVCRWLYNAYIAKNQSLYQDFKEGKINKKHCNMSANDFDKYINNEIKVLDDYKWINECGSKARKKLYVTQKLHTKDFSMAKANFLNSKRRISKMLNCTFPKTITQIGK